MMRKGYIVAILVLLLLASCENIYYSGCAGTVYDSDERTKGVSGVSVYGYTSLEERDRAYASWSGNTVFSDSSCLYRAVTDNSGKWSIPRIIWTNSEGAWGKDYDHTSLYLIYFSEDYGCWKSHDSVEIISGTSNANATVEYRGKERKSGSVTLNFRDGDGRNVPDEITMTIVYDSGYSVVRKDVSFVGGRYVSSLSYIGDSCSLSVEKIKSTSGIWEEAPDVSFVLSAASMEKEITMIRAYYDLGAGISGQVTAKKSVLSDASGNLVHTLDNLRVILEADGKEYVTYTGNGSYDGEHARVFSSSFSSLAPNLRISASSPVVTIRVNAGNTATERTFDLSENNNYTIEIESWT